MVYGLMKKGSLGFQKFHTKRNLKIAHTIHPHPVIVLPDRKCSVISSSLLVRHKNKYREQNKSY